MRTGSSPLRASHHQVHTDRSDASAIRGEWATQAMTNTSSKWRATTFIMSIGRFFDLIHQGTFLTLNIPEYKLAHSDRSELRGDDSEGGSGSRHAPGEWVKPRDSLRVPLTARIRAVVRPSIHQSETNILTVCLGNKGDAQQQHSRSESLGWVERCVSQICQLSVHNVGHSHGARGASHRKVFLPLSCRELRL